MAGYVYRGDQPHTNKKGPEPKPANSELCGTRQGEWRHRYLGETQCDKCREVSNEARRKNYHDTKDQPRKHMRLATIEKIQQAEKLFANGASQTEVQRQTGMSRVTIRQYFPGQGWTKEQAGKHSAAKRKQKNAPVDNPSTPAGNRIETARPNKNGPAVATNN